jgi:hypothetical protein
VYDAIGKITLAFIVKVWYNIKYRVMIYQSLTEKNMTDNFIETLPDVIPVNSSFLKKKKGTLTTIQARRNSSPIQGKVRGKRDHYTDKEKLNAVCVFAVTGNSRRCAEIAKLPEATIRSWKQTVWWAEAMSRVVAEKDEELTYELSNLVDKAVREVNDRLDNGNYVYDTKRGELIRKPVDAKELAIVTAIAIDKQQLLRGKPTSRTEAVSQSERLNSLQDQFRKFTQAKTIEQEPEVEIEEEELDEVEPLTINELFSEG